MERNCCTSIQKVRSRLWETACERYDLGAFRATLGDSNEIHLARSRYGYYGLSLRFADSTTFSTVVFQDQGYQSVPLGPGLDPFVGPTFLQSPQVLVFGTHFSQMGTVAYSAVLNLAGLQLRNEPYTDECPGNCEFLFSFELPPIYNVTPGSLSVTLNGDTATYDFRYQSPVPEATTLVLLGTGLMAGLWRKYSAAYLIPGGSGRLS